MSASVAGLSRESPVSVSGLLATAGLGVPVLLYGLLMSGALPNAYVVVPTDHFVIVSMVAAVAMSVALLLAIGTLRIGLYRLFFLTLGFMSMAALFTVHGLATPGFLIGDEQQYQRVVGLSAFLSLAGAGTFFALAYAPGLSRLERTLPLWPAGVILTLTVIGLGAYATYALTNADSAAEVVLSRPPWSWVLAGVSFALLVFAALRQWRIYRGPRLESQLVLVVAFLLLAEAQIVLITTPIWSLAWWEYHVLMLAATTLAIRSLAVEMARGRSLRGILESTFDLDVAAGEELHYDPVVAAMAAAVEVKDRETAGHNARVAEFAVKIGRRLELPARDLMVLARSGLLHDVGKLGVPDTILQKPGRLDESEWAEIRKHPLLGVTILERTSKFKRELLAVLYHHERMDGSGYPHGLAGEAIPIEARIVAVADTYDVLTCDRPYRKAMPVEQAQRILREEAGAHLDARVVAALLEIVGATTPALDGGLGAPVTVPA